MQYRNIRSVISWLLAAFVLFPILAHAEPLSDKQLARLVTGLPQEIVDFAERVEGCYVWSHEPSESDIRTAEIKKMFAKLKCASITADQKTLYTQYKDNKGVNAALDYITKKFAD